MPFLENEASQDFVRKAGSGKRYPTSAYKRDLKASV
jgi:hypothetical protein